MIRSLTRRPRSAIRQFLRSEAAGGIVLMAAALAALLVANSPLAAAYQGLLHADLGPLSVQHWVNDGLMALFFFVVGLEIKREWLDGHLSTWDDRRLPFMAAIAGMAVPAAVYLLITIDRPSLARGWAIPAATDIAFALGVLALLGKRAPASLKLFLTTVAIVDDMGAVAIIAVAYTAAISGPALLGAGVTLAAMHGLKRLGVRSAWPYLLGFAVLWTFVLASGIHATIAGVLAALSVPLHPTPGAPDRRRSTLHRIENALHPWVAYVIVPVFAFANAGVGLGGVDLQSLAAPLPVAVALGLFVGKQVGVFGAVRAAVALGFAKPPAKATWRQLYGVALLCGIGFTMSLFIGSLAFADETRQDAVKIGVLIGSVASALAGYLLIRTGSPKPGSPAAP